MKLPAEPDQCNCVSHPVAKNAAMVGQPSGYYRFMIARHWRGWTKPQDADEYESLLKTRILPGLQEIPGYKGAYILRRNGSEESEFVVINFFDSLDAVRKFAGRNYSVPVFDPEAKRLLVRFEPIAMHYEVRVNTVG